MGVEMVDVTVVVLDGATMEIEVGGVGIAVAP